MIFPSPEDPGRAPVWENYVIAQAVQASLGLIPRHALAMGVEVHGREVRLHSQLSELAAGDAEDLADIVDELGHLLGDDVSVRATHELRDRRAISPHDGIQWIYLARFEHEEDEVD